MKNEIEKPSGPDVKEPIELVKEVQKELSDYRRQFEKEWREYDNAYYGKQHKTGESKKTVKNHIFKIIEGEVPILTDSMPGTQIDSDIVDRQIDAEILNKSIKFVYNDQNLPLILPTLVRSGLMSAPGWLYAYYNPDAAGGEGKIEYRQLPWEYVFIDGNAQTIEQADKARIEIPMRRDAIARMWPEKKDEILGINTKQDTNSVDSDNFETRDISGGEDMKGRPAFHKAKDIVKYVETWVKSYELEPIPQDETAEEIAEHRQKLGAGHVPCVKKWQDHDAITADLQMFRGEVLSQFGIDPQASFDEVSAYIDQLLQSNPQAQDLSSVLLTVKMIDNCIEEHAEFKKINPSSQRPKFADGWRLFKTVESVILYDGPNPDAKDDVGHIPLVPFYGYKDDTIYGFGEIKNIIDSQRSLNDADFRELEGLRVCSNPGWVADHEAEIDENKLTNEPGIVVQKKKGTEVRRLEPGQVSPQLERRKMLDAEFMEDASGINRESQGNMAASASGVAIQKLQTQAVGRIRLKDRYLQYYSMKRLATITAQLILVHWTTEKAFRLRSDDSQIEEVVFNPLQMEDLGYSISISPGSMAGIDKDALNGFLLQLVQAQIITPEDFMTVAQFPKREVLLAKLKERNDQAATLEQLQQELMSMQEQNATLKGLVSPELLINDEKKVFDMASKQALIEKMMQQQAQEAPSNSVNKGANRGQPIEQGLE